MCKDQVFKKAFAVSSPASFISLADTSVCVRERERMRERKIERERRVSDNKPAKFVLKTVGKG